MKRVAAESDWDNMHSVGYAGEVLGQRDVCRSSEKALRVPSLGTSTVSMFNEKLRVDSLSLGDLIALQASGVFSKYSLLIPVRLQNPQAAPRAFCGARIVVFGQPKCRRMEVGGVWGNGASADFCLGR